MKYANKNGVGFTLDILTDGSEGTGNATVFLSVWKKSQYTKVTDRDWWTETVQDSNPVARYAISGIGDATSRLAADQRFKLASVQVVTLPHPQGCMDGLPALMFALNGAGSESLHVVGAENMEAIRKVVFGSSSRKHLQISDCDVPAAKDRESTTAWWQVYHDDYIHVHAGRCDRSDPSSVTYLYTMGFPAAANSRTTMAVLPPRQMDLKSRIHQLRHGQLPILDDKTLSVDIVFTQDVSPEEWKNLQQDRDNENSLLVMATIPRENDNGLLRRSRDTLHHLGHELPDAFPPTASTSTCALEQDSQDDKRIRLRSATSIVLDTCDRESSPILLDRRRAEHPDGSMKEQWKSTVESIKNYLEPRGAEKSVVEDDNEIDIDDESSVESADKEVEHSNHSDFGSSTSRKSLLDERLLKAPHLQILGTGCATPSAIRGASGHLLSFPSMVPAEVGQKNNETDLFLLDCGEGMATMLSRCTKHLYDENWARRIRGIWISHSHLDHYGGLPTLLRNIGNVRMEQLDRDHRDDESHPSKRVKRSHGPPCWVMAAPKVLNFLDIMLGCLKGVRISDGTKAFVPLLHFGPCRPPGPWNHFQNFAVDHNCYPSYGVLIGWSTPDPKIGKHRQSWFCFSGDTRPSQSLVRVCRNAIQGHHYVGHYQPSFLLLHEATFEDSDQNQAIQKKHSTLSEAMQVAHDAKATRLLLTHFSQRYVSLQQGQEQQSKDDSTQSTGKATIPMTLTMDGLCVPLEYYSE